jgi:hypothetical protein
MTNRRDFLRAATLTAGGLATAARGATATAPALVAQRPLALHAVLIEAGSPQARAFGTRLAARESTRVLTVPAGDVTSVWLQQIGPAWRRHPVAIAGLTSRPALFCLEQLSALSGLRVLFHAEHIVLQGGRTEHQLLRGERIAGLGATELHRLGPLWPGRLADAVVAHRASGLRERAGPSEAALEPSMPPGATLLTSWIIAPA